MAVFKPSAEITIDNSIGKAKLAEMGRISVDEIKMVVWLIVLVAFWLSCSWFGIPMATGTMVICGLMFIPFIGVLTPAAMKEIDATTTIFAGCATAIGAAGGASGMSAWIAALVLPASFPANPVLIVLFVAIVSIVVHMIIGGTLPTTAIVVPIMLAFTGVVDGAISGMALAFIAYTAVNSHYLISAHNLSHVAGMGAAGYKDSDITRFGLPLTLVAIVEAFVMYGWLCLIGIA